MCQKHTEKSNPSERVYFQSGIPFILLFGAEGGFLAKELHRAGYDVSASALSQRWEQILVNVFRDIFMGVHGECVDSETFRGFRLLAVDETAVSIPRNPKPDSFVLHSGAPNGYNQLHMTPLYDILNKVYLEAAIQLEPQKDEIGAFVLFVFLCYDRGSNENTEL